jgi:catechol 2,3-dioxygenase-like lactoylglutathione lyase family enzyme
MTQTSSFSIAGFTEVVCVVNDLQRSLSFYCDVIGWVKITEESQLTTFNSFWGIAPSVQSVSCLVRAPNRKTGAIRLIEFNGIEQEYIRANSQIWDVGGIFDINTRVVNVHQLARKLHQHQWFGVNEPVEMQFGPFKVYEWLAKSHDGITHALIERIEPPLEPNLQPNDGAVLFSELINASMIIDDHQTELDFFTEILGFKTLIHQEDTFKNEVSNVFGMPFELVAGTPHVLTLLSADGTREGTVELASFPQLTGNDFSHKNKPSNIGITTLRFPVTGLSLFKAHLDQKKVSYTSCNNIALKPYGNVDVIAVQTPSKNRLEFFEVIEE